MDPFDLTRHLQKAPLDSVVDLLRSIHQRSEGEPPAGPRGRAARPEAGNSSARSPIVAALKALHERGASGNRLESAAPAPLAQEDAPASDGLGETSYDRVRDHFHQHEASLRRQAWLTDQILDRMQTEGVAPVSTEAALQQELRLRCPVGGRAGGAFVLVNEYGRPVEVSFRRSALRGAPVGFERAGTLRFDPDPLVLATGAERVVHLSFDLADCPLEIGDELGLVVDVLGDQSIMLKLWVTIELHAAQPAAEVSR